MRTLFVIGTLALLGPAAALAAGGYDRVTLREPGPGQPVQPPLDEFTASASARIISPRDWTRLKDKAVQVRFRTARGTCRYVVSWSVHSRVGDDMDATAYLDKALAAPANAHVYEEGTRNGHPFRVIKTKATAPSTSVVRGKWVAILTRRKDIAPAGKVVWAEISAIARSIADGMAVATVALRFKKK